MFTPFHSFCGGLTIAGAVHELLVETGLVFGISGFFHRMTGALTRSISRKPAKHEKDAASATSNNDAVALAAIVGLVTGGVLLRIWLSEAERAFGVPIFDPPYHASFRASALAGFLQGYGTRVSLRSYHQNHAITALNILSSAGGRMHKRSFHLRYLSSVQTLDHRDGNIYGYSSGYRSNHQSVRVLPHWPDFTRSHGLVVS
jgi:hypothetical protein